MSTPNRIEINRANAQLSTGPKTESGKKTSSLNAIRHGLTAQTVVMPAEDPVAYQQHVQSLADEYHPQGATETLLVQALADASWRLNRVTAIEATLLAAAESPSKTMCNLSLHTQRLSRQFEKTVIQLRALQKIRLDQEKHDLNNVLDLLEIHKDRGTTYVPSQDGFVFTESEIAAAQRVRNRERLIEIVRKHRSHRPRHHQAPMEPTPLSA